MDWSCTKFRTYLRVSQAYKIARRLFVMNAFDGILTIMGVVIGAHFSGLTNPDIVITAGVGGSIAMGISGMSGAYLAERAERRRDLKKLESAMLIDLKKSQFAKASEFATIVVALVDGISPAVGAIILVLPYFFVPRIDMEAAFLASLGLGLLCLFVLGLFLARISHERMIVSGMRMILVGLLTIGIVSLVSAPGAI
ncbi:MAG TPA: VIT1/CCC1 transporter family protein [Methanothrix sp.]|nr:VIT1/CCC1 transporter family protein [Methanothrix sp.]HPJ85183.1 VIT1/CCC1 transporter family protein [Methanothrix sp.]HPR66661.1 VIT1/CCC1 transporter family protein [Methanothrix sp.]